MSSNGFNEIFWQNETIRRNFKGNFHYYLKHYLQIVNVICFDCSSNTTHSHLENSATALCLYKYDNLSTNLTAADYFFLFLSFCFTPVSVQKDNIDRNVRHCCYVFMILSKTHQDYLDGPTESRKEESYFDCDAEWTTIPSKVAGDRPDSLLLCWMENREEFPQ